MVFSYRIVVFTMEKDSWAYCELEEAETWPEVIELFSCSAQLSTKFFLLINVKMPTIVGILTIMSRKNSILHLSEHKKSRIS